MNNDSVISIDQAKNVFQVCLLNAKNKVTTKTIDQVMNRACQSNSGFIWPEKGKKPKKIMKFSLKLSECPYVLGF